MSYTDKGEITREYYRRQGEKRMLETVITELEELEASKKDANWSPRYIISLLRGINEARNN